MTRSQHLLKIEYMIFGDINVFMILIMNRKYTSNLNNAKAMLPKFIILF